MKEENAKLRQTLDELEAENTDLKDALEKSEDNANRTEDDLHDTIDDLQDKLILQTEQADRLQEELNEYSDVSFIFEITLFGTLPLK